jgi:hypothetical protein
MASQVSGFIIVETAAGIAETVAAICAFACGRPVNYPPVGFSLNDAEKISLGPAPTTGPNDLRQRASARCAACRRTPEMPFSSTGPISVKVTLTPVEASTTSWVTRTSPGRAYSAIREARFTVRP